MSCGSSESWDFGDSDSLVPTRATNLAEVRPSNATTRDAGNVYARRLRHIYAKLYPYQRELFRVSMLQDSLIHLQTGGGKTWVAAALICLHLAMHPMSRVFFVVRTVVLAAQQAKLLGHLLDVPVACVAGGTKQFRTADAFCMSPEYRVAVIVDSRFFEWLSAAPRLITERAASLVVLDEAHHAQSGHYRSICERFFFLRDGKSPQRADTVCHLDRDERRKCLRDVGARSADATVLSAGLQHAEKRERQLRENLCGAIAGEGDGIGTTVESPVLELLLSRYPVDMVLPQLVGLSASPVPHFNKCEVELLELFLVLRCRLVGVVDEVADLRLHRPDPAIMALSYLPLYEERVLQTALRQVIAHVFRRMEALVPEDVSARKRMVTLRTTSLASPSFAVCCRQFETDVVMSSAFKKALRIPAGSALLGEVRKYLARKLSREDDTHSSSSNNTTFSVPSTLAKEEETHMCFDYFHFALRFLRAASAALIALQDESYESMICSFQSNFSSGELRRIGEGCGPITAIVLRPVIQSVFELMKSVKCHHHHMPLSANTTALTSAAAGPERSRASSPTSFPSHATPGVSLVDRRVLPLGLRDSSTYVQMLMRLFTEFAAIATTMANAAGNAMEQNLRVLVFVETRDTAIRLVKALADYAPSAYEILRPEVLLGQNGKKSFSTNSMTRAEQTALLERFRAGETRIVFATTVAEEGIDLPACHVVMRCLRHIELRNIIQCCGRLRMKKTLFISLSNLLNGHPRLGFVMDAIHQSEALLRRTVQRCCSDAWNLETDTLLTGNNTSVGSDDDGPLSITLPVNPNETTRFTTQEEALLALQRTIAAGLQRKYQSEIFCIHSRDLPGQPATLMQVTLMMSIPVRATVDRAARLRWKHLRGSGIDSSVRAAQRAFVDFCKNAQVMGCLTTEGGVAPPSPGDELGGALAHWDRKLEALNVGCNYARSPTPSVVFLGASLCLCSRKTWPPSVLMHFFGERAWAMTMYVDDLWTSKIEPQTVLREELRDADASAPQFFITRRGDPTRTATAARVAELESVNENGNDPRSTAYPSTTVMGTLDYRNCSRAIGPESAFLQGAEEFAEVVFELPMSVVDMVQVSSLPFSPHSSVSEKDSLANAGGDAADDLSGQLPTLSSPTRLSAEKTTLTESGCSVTECDVEVQTTDKRGKKRLTRRRKIRIRYCGAHASKVVSLEGLRHLGVTIMYGVDKAELMTALSTCCQVGRLD
ncbi:ATP-dependent DEAD/H RNA helicase [Lotmaria passim]